MKREKHKLKLGRRKVRWRWLINPRTRVHGVSGYRRSKQKETDRRVIERELRELEGEKSSNET